MTTQARILALLLAALLLAACGPSAPQATPTSLPSATLTATTAPSITPSPSLAPTLTATATLAPTSTPEPSATPKAAALPMPQGKPASEWEGVPIMPGAIAGEDDSTSYLFTIAANEKEIQAFYEKALKKLGYGLLGAGEGKTGNVILIFTGDSGSFSIAIIDPGTGDGIRQVMLVKS